MIHLSLHDFYCKTCDKIYPSQLDLDQHTCASSEDRILKERNLHCTACDEAFASLPDLDQHQCSADDNKKRYKCGICGMLFQSLKRLEKHVESHPINERNKQMHGCGQDGAKRHTTDPDRFMVKCLKCSKCFVNNASLDLYMLSHTQACNNFQVYTMSDGIRQTVGLYQTHADSSNLLFLSRVQRWIQKRR